MQNGDKNRSTSVVEVVVLKILYNCFQYWTRATTQQQQQNVPIRSAYKIPIRSAWMVSCALVVRWGGGGGSCM